MEEKNAEEKMTSSSFEESVNPEEVCRRICSVIEDQTGKINQMLSNVPEEERNELLSLVMRKADLLADEEPFHHVLKECEKAAPGSAKAIIEMAAAYQQHMINQEATELNALSESQKRTQWMEFIIAIAFIVASAILLIIGKRLEGLVVLAIAAFAAIQVLPD